MLRAFNQQQIGSGHARQKEQVTRRKSRKAQERAERREGKDDACADDEQRRRAERDAWAAAQRVSRGPNDEDDQGRRKRLDEPTGVKQLLRGAEDLEQRVKDQKIVSLSRRGFSASADPAADVFRVGSHPGRKGTAAIPHGYRPSVITKFAGPQYQGRRPLARYPDEVR